MATRRKKAGLLKLLTVRGAYALESRTSSSRVRGTESAGMRLTLSIELCLKVIALSSESVEVGSDIAPMSVGLILELILLLLMNCTPTLSTYLGIIKGSVLVSKGSVERQHSFVGITDFIFPCMENVVEALLLTTESFKSLLHLVRNGIRGLRS